MARKIVVVIDGEHYPPVTRRALDVLEAQGDEVVLAVLAGGSEKLGQVELELGVEVVQSRNDPEAALAEAIDRTGVRCVVDISDEPVLGYQARCRLASVALWKGAAYKGADFEFTPPSRPQLAKVPSVAVIGTGKRTGKTAVGGAVARAFKAAKLHPVVVAMGRGGPPEPETLRPGSDLSPQALHEFVVSGRHAASDYIEDALTAKVPTVGAWRAGGGLAGATSFGNYEEALKAAGKLDPGLLLMEGSGSAIPPAHFDSCILVVDARINPEHLCGYFGLYRVLLASLVVLTMCEETVDRSHLVEVERCLLSNTLSRPTVVRTIFRPYPFGEISGKKIWVATTASSQAGKVLKEHLEKRHGTQVIALSHALANREQLRNDLEESAEADALVVELKAAAVDVVTRYGIEKGIEVIYMDNRPEPVATDVDLNGLFLDVARQAKSSFAEASA